MGLVSSVADGVVEEAIAVATRTALAPRELLENTKVKVLRHLAIDPKTGTLDL